MTLEIDPVREEHIKSLFNKYAGMILPVREVSQSMDINGHTHYYDRPKLPDDDPVIKEIADLAAEHGLSLRVWLPGTGGTFEDENRLNMFVEKHDDGQYHITPSFFLG